MKSTTKKIQELYIPYDSSKKIKSELSFLECKDDQDWLNASVLLGKKIKHSLPDDMVKSIVNFSASVEQCALIIRGLPIDSDICATPYHGYISPSTIPLASACHMGMYQLLGIEPVAYKTENDGFLFRHVVPSVNGRDEKSSHGSYHTFAYHVDNPDLPLTCESLNNKSGCPEYLSLMALRADIRVQSNFVVLDELLARLNPGVVKELQKSQFNISRPDSFGSKNVTSLLPLLVNDENGICYCRYDKGNTTPTTKEAAAALLMLEAQLKEQTLKHPMLYQSGDLLIIKNQRVLHCREGFSPRNDGTDRWLTRIFGMHSLTRMLPVSANQQHIGQD